LEPPAPPEDGEEEEEPPDEEVDLPELLPEEDEAILTKLVFTAVSIIVVICGELRDLVISVSKVF
jgi:hypothetical protein